MQIYGGNEEMRNGKHMKFHIDRPIRFGSAASGMWAHRKIWMFFCLYRLIVQCRRAALSRDIGFSIAPARVVDFCPAIGAEFVPLLLRRVDICITNND